MYNLLHKVEQSIVSLLKTLNLNMPIAAGIDLEECIPPVIVVNANSVTGELVLNTANYSVDAKITVFYPAENPNSLNDNLNVCSAVYEKLSSTDIAQQLSNQIADFYVYNAVISGIHQYIANRRFITEFSIELVCLNKNIS